MANPSIIEKMKLSHNEVIAIVREWYLNDSYKDILQDENGLDFEEICDNMFDINDDGDILDSNGGKIEF